MRFWKAFPVCRAAPSASCPVSVNTWAQHRLRRRAVGENVTATFQATPDTCVWVHTCLWAELREATLANRHSCKLSGMPFQKTFGNQLLCVCPKKLSRHFSGIQLRLLNPCGYWGQFCMDMVLVLYLSRKYVTWWAVDWFCNVREKCGVRSTLCCVTSWHFSLPCSLLETQRHSLDLPSFVFCCLRWSLLWPGEWKEHACHVRWQWSNFCS